MRLERIGKGSHMGKLRGALILLTLAALPADAEERLKPPLFEIADVDRDTVPAGTPAAFEAIFGRAPHNAARREVGDSAYLFVPLTLTPLAAGRSAERRGGQECVSSCRARWSR